MKQLLKTIGVGSILLATVSFTPSASAAESPANAAAAAAAASTAAAPQAAAKEAAAKRHCLNVDLGTGTRLKRRACKTREEWLLEGVELKTKS